MKKVNLFLISVFIFALIGCEGKFEASNSLDPTNLLLPANNEQCLGTQLNNDKIRVEFDWEDIDQVTNYRIDYIDKVSEESQSLTTTDSYISIDLEPGTLYTWSVTVFDDFGNSKKSEDFSFYTEGLVEPNHVPFPAVIDIQENGNNINISWEGSDLDDDIDYYQVFFSKENPPSEYIDNTTEKSFNTNIDLGATYYINIITFDLNGNYSNSKDSIQF